jgi:hypothetical protein
MVEMKDGKDWWHEKAFLGLTRDDVMWIVIILLVAVVYVAFINWDGVFGLRHK